MALLDTSLSPLVCFQENFNRRHRLVCLSKLSAHAAGDMAAASAASSQLRLLQVQEKLGLVSGGPSGLGANGVVSLPTLVDAALKLAQNQAPAAEPHEAGGVMQAHGVQAALLAVEALAVCPAEERLANKCVCQPTPVPSFWRCLRHRPAAQQS